QQAREEADAIYLLEEIPKALTQALDGVGRVSSLVQAMKEVSHPGRKEMAPEDLNSAIRSTATVARNEWKYGATLNPDLQPDLPRVPCLLSDLNQVVLNLIVNAAHAIRAISGEPGETGMITLRTRECGQDVEIQVEDTGCGIPPELQDRVFEPFFTTKEVG